MILYHGTNGDIEEVCLMRGSRYKDFGQGFYVTPDIETARRMAKKKATAAWIRFIDDNRNRRREYHPHGFDLVRGPIADDGVALQLGRLRAHVDSADAIAIDLQDVYLDQQICFATQLSLEYLKKQSVCQL